MLPALLPIARSTNATRVEAACCSPEEQQRGPTVIADDCWSSEAVMFELFPRVAFRLLPICRGMASRGVALYSCSHGFRVGPRRQGAPGAVVTGPDGCSDLHSALAV
jgi:hypothetical protein